MRKLAIVVALSSTVLATPALARDGAWYVGVEGGAMIVEDIDVDIGTTTNAMSVDYDYGYDVGGVVGYDAGAFRIELEGAYKEADVEAIQTSLRTPGTLAGQFDFGGGNVNVLSGMVNGLLDFGDDSGVSGFVGGGVGMARVEFHNQRVFANQSPALSDSDTRLAWQVVAGVRQAISPNVEAHVKYRFFNVDDLKMVAFNGAETNARFRSHSLLGGFTFNFGAAPEPIPEPLPTPEPAPLPPAPPADPAPLPPPVVPQGPFIVFFDWDRSEITPQAAAILDNAASAYQQAGQAQVVLAGHADRSGSADYNIGLSQRRAEAVRSYLAGRGVPDASLRTEAFGESRPLVETADGVREPQNRRVEITFGPGSGW